MIPETRRAPVSFELTAAAGADRSGDVEAVIGDDALDVGPVTVAFQDVDTLGAADYHIQMDLWPEGRLVLSQLGRRFDTFVEELRAVRDRARVGAMLAHGITPPEVFGGALLTGAERHEARYLIFDTHITVVPVDGDPWQIPFGALTDVHTQDDPPAVVLESASGKTLLGQLGRSRDVCRTAIAERREAQRRCLAELTGQAGFSDGWGLPKSEVRSFVTFLERFGAEERLSCGKTLIAAATSDVRVGFVQLLDPDTNAMRSGTPLPENWAMFLLAPVGSLTVLEILAGPSAATYVFREGVDATNRDLQLLHFRRAPLALTAEQARLTPGNPYRLALRKLTPLQRLRAKTVARLIHNDAWEDALSTAVGRASGA